MSAKIHTAKAINGEVVQIVGSNDQENVRPGEYIVFDDDVTADVAIKSNQDVTKPIKRFDMFLIVMNIGLTQLGLAPANYNFTRAMRADIRNIGIHTKQTDEYKSLISAPAPVVANVVSPVDGFVARINKAVIKAIKAGRQVPQETIQAQVEQIVPVELRPAVLSKVLAPVQAPPPPPAPAAMDFSF